jgi:hypothetical protein
MRYFTAYPFWDLFWELTVPSFVLALVFAEGTLYFARRKRTKSQVILGGLMFVGSVVAWYVTQPATNPRILRPLAYFVFVAWIVFVPLALLAAGSYFLARARSSLLTHAGVLAMALVVSFVWPFFALSSLCGSGLDCI